jgi:hypothetical protein
LQVVRDGAHVPAQILAYLIDVASALAVHMRPPSNALLPSLQTARPRSEIRRTADAAQSVSSSHGAQCVPCATTNSSEQPDPCGTINSEHLDDEASLQRVVAHIGGSLGHGRDLHRGLRFRLHLEGLRALEWGLHLLHVSQLGFVMQPGAASTWTAASTCDAAGTWTVPFKT